MLTLPVRVLSRGDIVAAGGEDLAAAIDDVAAVLRLMRSGDATMVPEAVLWLGRDGRDNAYALPALVGRPYNAAGLKWAIHRHVTEPSGLGVVSMTILNDPDTGHPRAIVESAFLTVMRTSAVSALALKTMMPAPLHKVALLGAGAQAYGHLAMLYSRFPAVHSITVWNRSPERLEAMLSQCPAPPSVAVTTAESASEAVRDADAVLCCTASPEPLLDERAVRDGRMILQIGYHEVSFAAIAATEVVTCDLWGEFRLTSAKSLFQMHRAGQFSEDRLAADLSAAVVDGWRPRPGASVFFCSFGLNVFDIAIAARVAATAQERNLGTMLDLAGASRSGSGPT